MLRPARYGEYFDLEDDLRRFRDRQGVALEGRSRDIRRILDCIHEHLFDRDLSVGTVRSRCRLRDNNISTRFRRAMGISLKHYIERLRMEAAARLLRERAVSVLDIALAVGYEHPQTFYQAFRRCYACTPAAYRARVRDRADGHDSGQRIQEDRTGRQAVLAAVASF